MPILRQNTQKIDGNTARIALKIMKREQMGRPMRLSMRICLFSGIFKKWIRVLSFLCTLFLSQQVAPVSVVYNFRIAQLTRQPIYPESNHRHHSIIALPFYLRYKKDTGPVQNYAGGLATYIFDYSKFYVRIDAAASSIQAKTDQVTTFSGGTTDDILLTAGYNMKFDRRATATFSGLFGIPTHRIRTLQHPDFGYGQVSLGLQVDGLYNVNQICSFIYGSRYIYFIPRTAYDTDCTKHTFSIGNIADILIALKNNWRSHGFELGYTFRLDFGAICCPALDDTIKKTNYLRSNFYAVYKYRFTIDDIANRLQFNIGYGFDHLPKYFGNKYILNLWASWRIHF